MADIKPEVSSTAGGTCTDVDVLQQDVVEIDTPFSEKTNLTDVALIVEGQSLFVSRLVMSLVSPVFRAMFEHEMTEKDKDEIILPDKCIADMVEFLLCVYPGKGNKITDANADQLLPLFDEYQVEDSLTTMCGTVLEDRCNADSTIGTLLKLLDQACTYRLENLKSKCLKLISYSGTSLLINVEETYPIPAEVWRKVIQRRDIEIELLKELPLNHKPKMNRYGQIQVFLRNIKLARCENIEYIVKKYSELYSAELWYADGSNFKTQLDNSGLPEDIKYNITALLMKMR